MASELALRSLLLALVLIIALQLQLAEPIATNFSRRLFPDDFVFGTSSSAYQYEGAARTGGRGPSVWDTFALKQGDIVGNANGNVATDDYHHYEEDISLMSAMGMDAFRFSISWSRIFPEGKGQINQIGISYYNNVINALLAKGIQPFVTLYHWDLPQKLQDEYGGWLSSLIVQDYAHYVETCFKHFGDRVKHWITFNEPTIFILFGYNNGTFPPQRCSPWVGNCTTGDSATEPYIVAHNVLLSHAAAVDIYRTKFQKHQKGQIGLTNSGDWYVPLSKSREDAEAVERLIDFRFGWYLEPLLYGEYPAIMRKLLGGRLPSFTKEQKRKLIGSLDFIGINYYTTSYVAAVSSYPNPNKTDFFQDTMTKTTGKRNGVMIGPQAASPWLHIVPSGIYHLLKYIKQKYNVVPPIYITENGVDEVNNSSLALHQALEDPIRIKYHNDHLLYLAASIMEGVNVRGYFVWSLLDDFEWTSGYSVRFGLHFVDYKTLERYPKASAKWFKKGLKRETL